MNTDELQARRRAPLWHSSEIEWDPRDFDTRGLTLRQPPRGYCLAFVLAPVLLAVLAWWVW